MSRCGSVSLLIKLNDLGPCNFDSILNVIDNMCGIVKACSWLRAVGGSSLPGLCLVSLMSPLIFPSGDHTLVREAESISRVQTNESQLKIFSIQPVQEKA